MSWLDKAKELGQQLKENASDLAEKAGEAASKVKDVAADKSSVFKDKIASFRGDEKFAYAVISSALAIAYADGDFSLDEQQKLRAYIDASDNFGLTEDRVNDIVVELTGKFNVDLGLGVEVCKGYLTEVKDKEYTKEIVILAVAIAKVDDDISGQEQAMINSIVAALKLDPEEFK